MGLFGKIKDILFDEEEVIEEKQSEKVKEKTKEEEIKKTEYKPPVVTRDIYNYEETQSEKKKSFDELEKTFPFPDFDEDEFESIRPASKPKTTNVLDFERHKRKEKREDRGRLEKVEVVEKKKFKPSPIISPVYGILNEDYVIDDIVSKKDISETGEVSIDSVRKKAFGEKEEEPVKKEVNKEQEIVKSFEPIEEKEEKVKTIDELLEDTSDVKISIEDDEEIPSEVNIEEDSSLESKEEEPASSVEDDTIENDLFDLIDSMYDKGEE